MRELSLRLNEKLYLRDPQGTQLGRRIIQKGVEMIDQLGFEQFTFKKLALEVNSTEPSIYRYFENKQRLLQYLSAWYWSWIDYRLELVTNNLNSPEAKLKAAIRFIAEEKKFDPTFNHIDEEALHRVVGSELEKTYLTKWVDADHQAGLFESLNHVTGRLSGFIREAAPDYAFPNSIASTLLLAAHRQFYFMQYIPAFSDLKKSQSKSEQYNELRLFLETLVFQALRKQE